MKICIMGSGVYGRAIGSLCKRSGNDVIFWTEKENLSDVIIPEGTSVTNIYEDALIGSDIVFIVTGSKYVKGVLESIKGINDDAIFVLGSKGILEGGITLDEVFESIFNKKPCVISGPTFAVDIDHNNPVGFTFASSNINDYTIVKNALKMAYIEYSNNILGVELAGSLKNAYAIGSGILESFNYGPSTRMLYLYKVIDEIKSIYKEIGIDENTIYTLSGIGDLFMTSTSLNSRNFTFGNIVGLGNKEDIDKYLSFNTVEGYDNLKSLNTRFKEYNTPILKDIYEIVYNGKNKDILKEDLI